MKHTLWIVLMTGFLLGSIVTLTAGGCASAKSVGAAQLWERTCQRCHNLRSPASYSDLYWNISTMHMQIHAYLTGEEKEIIRKFLNEANNK